MRFFDRFGIKQTNLQVEPDEISAEERLEEKKKEWLKRECELEKKISDLQDEVQSMKQEVTKKDAYLALDQNKQAENHKLKKELSEVKNELAETKKKLEEAPQRSEKLEAQLQKANRMLSDFQCQLSMFLEYYAGISSTITAEWEKLTPPELEDRAGLEDEDEELDPSFFERNRKK